MRRRHRRRPALCVRACGVTRCRGNGLGSVPQSAAAVAADHSRAVVVSRPFTSSAATSFFLCLFLRPTSCRSRVDSRLPVPFLLLDRLPLDTKGRRCTSGQTCSPSCVRPSYLSLSIAYLCFSLFLFVLSAVCREFECADVS